MFTASIALQWDSAQQQCGVGKEKVEPNCCCRIIWQDVVLVCQIHAALLPHSVNRCHRVSRVIKSCLTVTHGLLNEPKDSVGVCAKSQTKIHKMTVKRGQSSQEESKITVEIHKRKQKTGAETETSTKNIKWEQKYIIPHKKEEKTTINENLKWQSLKNWHCRDAKQLVSLKHLNRDMVTMKKR